MQPKTDVTHAILSRDFVTRVREFIAWQSSRCCDCQVACFDCCINKHGFCTTLPISLSPSQSQFQNDEIVPYLIFPELFYWSYAFVLQDSLPKLNSYQEYRNQSCWFGLFAWQSCSMPLHSHMLQLYRTMKSRDKVSCDKIAGVISV